MIKKRKFFLRLHYNLQVTFQKYRKISVGKVGKTCLSLILLLLRCSVAECFDLGVFGF